MPIRRSHLPTPAWTSDGDTGPRRAPRAEDLGGSAFVYVAQARPGPRPSCVARTPPRGADFGHAVSCAGLRALVGVLPLRTGPTDASAEGLRVPAHASSWTETQSSAPRNGRSFMLGAGLALTPPPSWWVHRTSISAGWGPWKGHGKRVRVEWNGLQWQQNAADHPQGANCHHASWFARRRAGGWWVARGRRSGRAVPPGFVHLASTLATSCCSTSSRSTGGRYSGNGQRSPRAGWERPCLEQETQLAGPALPRRRAILPRAGAAPISSTCNCRIPQPTFYCSASRTPKGCIRASSTRGWRASQARCRAWATRSGPGTCSPRWRACSLAAWPVAANAPFAGGLLCRQQPARGHAAHATSASSLPRLCNGFSFSYDFQRLGSPGGSGPGARGRPRSLWMQMWVPRSSGLVLASTIGTDRRHSNAASVPDSSL